MQMEIEESALKKEEDRLSKERLEHLQEELADLKEQYANKKVQWENEKKSVERVQKIREEIEQVNKEIQKAQREYDLNRAAELQYGRLPQLQKQLEEEEEQVKAKDLSPCTRGCDRRRDRAHRIQMDGHPCGETE